MNETNFWIFKYNLQPLFLILSQLCDYNFDENEWQGI